MDPEIAKLREEIEKKAGKSPEELYAERERRLDDAIHLREPDRVPVIVGGGYFALKYVGMNYATAYYDPAKYKAAFRQMVVDFEPDAYGSGAGGSGRALEILGAKSTRWPGYNLPVDMPNQSVDGEYMKADEYDLFLDDPSDFIVRRYLPRNYSVLEPLAKLPPLRNAGQLLGLTSLLGSPELQKVGQAIAQAEEEQKKYRQALGNQGEELVQLGFASESRSAGFFGGGVSVGSPFDTIANQYRGQHALTDMIRQPDKLLAAIDKIAKWRNTGAAQLNPLRIVQPNAGGTAAPAKEGFKRTGGPIHRGSDEFMSIKQWEKFYWPEFRSSIWRAIEQGYTVSVFCEGRCESRLEYFLEFPKGSMILRFSYTDMKRVKEVIGGHHCIQGAVPPALLQMASPSEVDDYCKNLIKVCGKGGGFILRAATDSIQDAKPENVKAMVESCKKYRP